MSDVEWTVEFEPEVDEWLKSLRRPQLLRVLAYLRLLRARGVLLGAPYTRQLDGKLRELRFPLDGGAFRISYFIASGRRVVMLTVFRKQRQRERREVERAARAMRNYIAEPGKGG
ncbi:MAG: type II toxin-antitoxin system RelE/ParE family toxin [Dehalococcoidia bacterium]